jgi:hypothetical protein
MSSASRSLFSFRSWRKLITDKAEVPAEEMAAATVVPVA